MRIEKIAMRAKILMRDYETMNFLTVALMIYDMHMHAMGGVAMELKHAKSSLGHSQLGVAWR